MTKGRAAAVLTWLMALTLAAGIAPATLKVRMDKQGPYLILISRGAAGEYAEAVRRARALHPEAKVAPFSAEAPDSIRTLLQANRPRYALIFILPGELDADFAWRLLRFASDLDEDTFLDVRYGFICGCSGREAADFVGRIADALAGKLQLPARLVDNLGPNETAAKGAFFKNPGSFMLPALAVPWSASTISFGQEGFGVSRLAEMDGAGIVHFGGHGYPDRVIGSLNALYARRIKLSPCLVSSGACYTGVTGRWLDVTSGRVAERRVAPELSFCLGILANRVVAYMAALHADHGIPVYQELECLAYGGGSLGDVIKGTLDGVELASGCRRLSWGPLVPGGSQGGSPAEVMLRGAASRVLFGDPALIIGQAICPSPFRVEQVPSQGEGIVVRATIQNPELRASFSDTYHADLSPSAPYNDRALIEFPMPKGKMRVISLSGIRVMAGGKLISHRLTGFGVDVDGGKRILRLQVDVAATGFWQSPFRSQRGWVEVVVR